MPSWKASINVSMEMPLVVVVVVGRFYIALFSVLEQTHCTRM